MVSELQLTVGGIDGTNLFPRSLRLSGMKAYAAAATAASAARAVRTLYLVNV
jgi:hypothetical protein